MNYNNAKGQLTYQLDIDKQQKNGFPIPCDFYSTGKLGLIYPTQALPVTYGDKIKNTSSAAVQFNPLAVPIMANMFIKQEHYYTPRNCVWQNWDNFISGGEDMQFATPPPSFTIARLFNRLLNTYLKINKHANLSFKSILTIGTTQLTKPLLLPYVDMSTFGNSFVDGTWENELLLFKAFASDYGVSDIYKVYIQNVVDEIVKFLKHKREEYGNNSSIILFASKWIDSVDTYNGISVNDRRAILPPDYVKPDYFATIEKSLPIVYIKEENGNIVNDTNTVLELYLTEDGYTLYNLFWKLFKPFIGEGSYLDCLNMNRMVFTDFMYVVYNSFYEVYTSIAPNATISDISSLYMPMVGTTNVLHNTLSDLAMDCLNLRTLYLIWYNNYRDQLLETKALKPRNTDTIADDEMILLTIPRHRCWEKDSYTTALDNPATADAVVPAHDGNHDSVNKYKYLNGNLPANAGKGAVGVGIDELSRNDGLIYKLKFANGETVNIPTGLISGLTENKTPQINTTTYYFSLHMLDAVRRAQKFLRKALFYGNRIQDFIWTTWAVQHLDARLRLPEILSTSTDMVELQTLVNNTTVVGSTVAGDRAGLAKGYDKGNYFERYCEEAGVIMSLFTIMPEPTYAYGSDRQYYKFDRFEYPIPEFATLGMDAVYDSELVCLPTKVAFSPTDPSLTAAPRVFGYQGRYYDSKFRQSTEHGELLTTQDMYTFGRRWNMYDPEGRPVLNYEFVHCFPPLDMFVMEDQTEDYFRMNVHHDTKAELTLPYHSIYL